MHQDSNKEVPTQCQRVRVRPVLGTLLSQVKFDSLFELSSPLIACLRLYLCFWHTIWVSFLPK